jgi:hypothetical protein
MITWMIMMMLMFKKSNKDSYGVCYVCGKSWYCSCDNECNKEETK